MATNYYYIQAGQSFSGCPGTAEKEGWYQTGNPNPITTTYKNPTTGLPYTVKELGSLTGGGTVPVTTTPTGAVPTTSQLEAHPTGTSGIIGSTAPHDVYTTQTQAQEAYIANAIAGGLTEEQAQANWAKVVSNIAYSQDMGVPSTSQLEAGTTIPAVTPAATVAGIPSLPAYQPSAAMEALSTQVGGAISGIIEQGGMGMGEETKQQIFLKEAEIINAGTAQAMKNLEDKMAAQGLSNSGMAFSEGMKLASKGTIAMANVMRDVEIQDSLMKVASYQNALGLGVQFLSYLSEESWRQYQPTLYQWQAQVDVYKLAITDAYNKQDLALAHRYDMELTQFEAQTNIKLTQMTIDAAADAASKKNFWDILGTGLGILAGILF